MFSKIIEKTGNWLYANRIKKIKHHRQFISLEKASRVGFVLSSKSILPEETNRFITFIQSIESLGKSVYVIELPRKKKSNRHFGNKIKSILLDKKYFNFFNLPSQFAIDKINGYHFDILVDLNRSEELTSRYLTGLSNAVMRVGIHDPAQTHFYDLMLSIDPRRPAHMILENLNSTLTLFNK
jgi:hypothetical protein